MHFPQNMQSRLHRREDFRPVLAVAGTNIDVRKLGIILFRNGKTIGILCDTSNIIDDELVLPGPRTSEGRNSIRHTLFMIPAAWLLCSATLPLQGPVPEPRPDSAPPAIEKTGEPKEADDKVEPPEVEVRPIDKEDPELFAACSAELNALGAGFSEAKRIDDGHGCGIDRPLEVKSLGHGVALSPPGMLRCQAAVNLTRWTHDVVIPMLKKSQPAETLAAVNQASAYVCRKRNGASTGKISEHARGTAIDIAGFTFKSGRTFTIAPREEEPTLNGAFQRAIAAAACLYFSTVLDPGSDAAHETHLHLDTIERRGGYRYCW
jgi:hypothetical protein